jgi:hypothetical protein
VGDVYKRASFISHKWTEQRIQYITILDQDFTPAYVEMLKDPLSKEYNLTEFLFEMAKEFPGVYLCSAIISAKKDTEEGYSKKIDARLILGYENKFLSSDDIFDMYKSGCLFAHIGYPKSIEMSCSMKKRKICPDDNLLMLSHVEEFKV